MQNGRCRFPAQHRLRNFNVPDMSPFGCAMTSERAFAKVTGTRMRAIGRHFSLESVSPAGQAERFSVVVSPIELQH
jgi:hypothetical protein